MFAVRRIFRSNKQLINYISTSSILQCDEGKKTSNLFRKGRKYNKVVETEKKHTDINLNDIISSLRPQKRERTEKKSPLSEVMVSSVEKVANELGGDEEKTKTDLLEYVRMLDVAKDTETVPEELESGDKPRKMSYKDWVEATPKETLDREGGRERERRKNVVLGVFKKSIMDKENEVELKIWDTLTKEELAARAKQAPANYYEELINWTNEGRLWRFPIDNDQGMEKEAATSFTEHVFLEKHLEPWCPKKGPIKKFMELVLVGLGKNPHLTVKEKRAHIMWFKFYFEEKKKLLQELGAMGPTKLEVSSQEPKA